MKNLKIFFIIMVVAILAIMVMPASVFASELITEIKLTGPEIKSGNSMSSLVNIEATPKEAISNTSISLIWYENDTSLSSFDTFMKFMNEIPATGNFVEEKYYIINTLALPGFLTINSGYELGNGVKYYYNGEEVASVSNTGTLAYNWIKAESPIIKELSITGVEEPVFGERANQSTLPVVTMTPNIKNETEGGWFKAESSFDKNHTLTLDYIKDNAKRVKITSNIDKNPIYEEGIYILVLGTETEYDFILDDNFKSMINGKEVPYELKNNHLIYQYYVVEVKEYSYKYISGDSQEFTKGKVNNYTFTIDGDYEKFESLKIGDISLVKDTDYTVAEGSTIITLTATGITKLNTLTSGTYNVETKFTGNTVTGKLVIKDEVIQEENNQTEETTETIEETTETTEENPQTGDGIISSVILGSISLISLFGCGLYINTKKKYN